jgi:PAS domain S-box-containing protein
MPQIQYPFIDIAVHPIVRARFAAGEAIVLFSRELDAVLWANGDGAQLFGFSNIYDFMEDGPDRGSVSFRQLSSAARQLAKSGDRRNLMMRVASGFSSQLLSAEAALVMIRPGEEAVLFAAPSQGAGGLEARIQSMLRGFDDPDTHMAVLDASGAVLAASPGFDALGVPQDTTRALIASVERSTEGLVKRPIASSAGYLPAAIGKLSDDPALHLLFCVETVLGRMDPPGDVAQAGGSDAETAQESDAGIVTAPEAAADDLSTLQPAEGLPEASPIEPVEDVEVEALTSNGEALADELVQHEQELLQADEAQAQTAEAGAVDQPVETASEEIVEPAVDAPEPEPVPAIAAAAPEEPAPAFTPNKGARPVRFVWKLDADGRFSDVSDEFVRTVGERAGAVKGKTFKELANLLDLDPDGEIGRLLERRDTWSGRTIRWPIEGSDYVAPVDLAALPTYSRNREFDGFRGFGIIRIGDAERDPHAMGMAFAAPVAKVETPAAPVIAEPVAPAPTPVEAAPVEDAAMPQDTTPASPDSPEEDAFQGEKPAIRIMPDPVLDLNEKIVKLEERRARAREGLSAAEQAALKEIARQLEPFGKRPNAEVTAPSEIEEQTVSEEQIANTEVNASRAEAAPEIVEPVFAEPEDIDLTAPITPETSGDEPIAVASRADDTDDADEIADARSAREDVERLGLTAAAADQVPLAMLIHAGDRLIHANTEFLRFTGYETLAALEAAGGLDGLIHRSDDHVLLNRADGERIPVTARLQSVRFEGATALALSLQAAPALLPDPLEEDEESARRLASLKVELDELHSILETATDGVIVLDTEGRIRSMNRSASALFNFDDGETRGKPFAMLFAHESQKAVQDYLSGLSGHGVASVLNDGREVIGREASGGFIPMFMTLGRMPGSNSYFAVIRDITQWKRSEEELRNAKRAAETANQHKSDFLARVSHEIRTPLNAIIGFSDMIATEHFGPAGHPRYIEYAHDIGRSGRHVLDIVNDLLDISKIEAGEMDLDLSAVAINECVSEAVSLVQQQANAQRVIIRTSLSQSVPNVVADLRSIKQIAINILANAIRFTPAGGQIVVSTVYEPTGAVALRIRDTGVGMTATELEQAMKPFGQVSPSARKRGDGTGLGLPLTKAMTEANRAVFAIRSAPNEGTLVEILFPPQRVLAN